MNPTTATGLSAVRARTVLTLAGEKPARGREALSRPFSLLDDGVIVARDGIIQAVEPYRAYCRRSGSLPPHVLHDLGDVLVTPGLVNCHTHLEISHMADKTVLGQGFYAWLKSLVALDKAVTETAPEAALQTSAACLRAAARSLAEAGCASVGDISSRMPSVVLEALRAAGLEARVFCEIIGHRPQAACAAEAIAGTDPAFSLAGHAFYTTPGEAMAQAKSWCMEHSRPFSLHLAEHEDETLFLAGEQGEFNDLLRRSVVPSSWRAPGISPVRHAASFGLLGPGTLAVHCVHCDDAEVTILAESGSAVCLCPRSNGRIKVGDAPAAAFADKGALLCLGTDSLASNTDLDVWHEAEFFLKKNILPANALLRMATVNGAAILGMSDRVGRLEKEQRFCYKTFPSEMTALFR